MSGKSSGASTEVKKKFTKNIPASHLSPKQQNDGEEKKEAVAGKLGVILVRLPRDYASVPPLLFVQLALHSLQMGQRRRGSDEIKSPGGGGKANRTTDIICVAGAGRSGVLLSLVRASKTGGRCRLSRKGSNVLLDSRRRRRSILIVSGGGRASGVRDAVHRWLGASGSCYTSLLEKRGVLLQ